MSRRLATPPALVCAGNLVVDDIVLPDGTTRLGSPGGAVLFAALGAAIWDVPVALVAPVGDDYPQAALDALADRGVSLAGLRPLNGPGLRSWLLYEPGARRLLPRLGCPDHTTASPTVADLSPFLDARAVHLAPAPRDAQATLLRGLEGFPGLLSLDPHTMVTEETLPGWRDALARLDLFFVSAEEVALVDLATAPAAALARLAGGRLAHVLLKQGAAGGLDYDTGRGTITPWRARPTPLVDPTGAGDAFAGGCLAGLLAGESVPDALAWGAVSASFAVQAWGAEGLLSARPDEVAARLAELSPRARRAARPPPPA